jgi:hypothetical protein
MPNKYDNIKLPRELGKRVKLTEQAKLVWIRNYLEAE